MEFKNEYLVRLYKFQYRQKVRTGKISDAPHALTDFL